MIPDILFLTYKCVIIIVFQFCFPLQISFQISILDTEQIANKKIKITSAQYNLKIDS